MTLKECFAIENNCYKAKEKINKVKGIVVHSTGANNPNLKRYVQPVKEQKCYDEVIKDLGKNAYDNHWNQAMPGGKAICCHAFIGLNKAKKVETYQILPYDYCCWNCGKGVHGSYNYNPTAHIQFEICEDNLKDEEYFNKAMTESIEYCAYLCKKFNMKSSAIVSHKEAHDKGYASNHGDIDHWLKKFGKDMNWYRAEVDKVIKRQTEPKPITQTTGTTAGDKTTSKPATSTTKPKKWSQYTELKLNGTNLYKSATISKASKKITGTYYVYDGIEINGRYRITNAKKRCGKKPIAFYVTGYVKKGDLK